MLELLFCLWGGILIFVAVSSAFMGAVWVLLQICHGIAWPFRMLGRLFAR